jgi:tRNA(Ile)-lysidine synthase
LRLGYTFPVLERFLDHLSRSQLIPEGALVLVGYSGGADSMCLLHLLHRAGIDVVAAHLNHGQRTEGEKEAKMAAAVCEELGIPFVGGAADVPRMSRDLKIGIEEAGRQARYGFFEQARIRTGCDFVATAHTKTDHAETVLLNLVRGAGMTGLSGIPESRGHLIRPLLSISREETREYCREQGLWFHDDPTNVDLAYARPRIREIVMPELRRQNSAVEDAIVRMAKTIGEEDRFLNGMAAAALERAIRSVNGELAFLTEDVEAYFDRRALEHLPTVLFRRAIRLATASVGGALDSHQVETVVAGISARIDGSVTSEGGEVVLEWNDDTLLVRKLAVDGPYRQPLTLPGETISDDFGWTLTAEPIYEYVKPERANFRATISRQRVVGNLYFRSLEPGDKVQPLGFSGHRKLADLMSESGLTQAARARLPVICDMVGPIWVPGVVLDERSAARPDENVWLSLRFERTKNDNRHNGMERGVG